MLRRRTVSVVIVAFMVIVIAAIIAFNFFKNLQYKYDLSHLLPPGSTDTGTPFVGTPSPVNGMMTAAENENLILCVNTTSLEMAVVDKRSGDIWYTAPEEKRAISTKESSDMSSQFLLSYYNSMDKLVSVNSNDKCIAFEQFEIFQLSDGIRVNYTIGDVTLGIALLPKYVTEERLEEILAGVSEKDAKSIKNYYAPSKDKAGFLEQMAVLQKASGLIVSRILRIMDEAGYTEEDLLRDNAEAAYEMDISRQYVSFPVEYRLEGDAMVMNIRFDELEEFNDYRLFSMDVNKFFGAGYDDEDGFIVVPSGSGGLFYFNNGKVTADPYSQPIYGPDPHSTINTQLMYDTRLPVFGIKKANSACVVSLEGGEGLATINANISGMVTNYNLAYPSYTFRSTDVRNAQTVHMDSGELRDTEMLFIEKDIYQSEIKLVYMFLPGDVGYEDMAARYRERLIETGRLTQKSANGDVPMIVDIVGSVEKQTAFMGVPYTTSLPMTTYAQAEELVDMLNATGINNIQMRYLGWFNAGINHDIPKKISLTGSVGNSKALQSLQAKLAETGGALYPDVAILETKYDSRNFNYQSESALTAAGWIGYSDIVANMNRVTYSFRNQFYDASYKYIVNPNIVPSVTEQFIKASQKYNIQNISLRDLGNYLGGDQYEKANVNRDYAKLIAIEAMEKMTAHFDNVMVRGGYVYALAFADYLYDVPMYFDQFIILDEEIPFYQMVVHGYIDYAGVEFNNSEVYAPEDQLLRMMEYGSVPRFVFTYENTNGFTRTAFESYLSTGYTKWLDTASEVYRAYNDVYKNLRTATMDAHTVLEPGVARTDYSNGVSVYVNYNNYDVTVDGITVKAKGYSMGGIGA